MRAIRKSVISFGLLSIPIQLLTLILGSIGSASERGDWTNLVGLSAISETVSVSLNLEGAEDFDLKAERLRDLARGRLKDEGLLRPEDSQLPSVAVFIVGHSGGGGGAEYTIRLVLSSRVPSPFIKDRSIRATVWHASESDRQLMRYDSATKKVVKPAGPLQQRVEATLLQVIEALVADIRKANPRR